MRTKIITGDDNSSCPRKIPRNDLGIPENQMESLARILLPILIEYLESEKGRNDYEEWKTQKENSPNSNKHSVSADMDI